MYYQITRQGLLHAAYKSESYRHLPYLTSIFSPLFHFLECLRFNEYISGFCFLCVGVHMCVCVLNARQLLACESGAHWRTFYLIATEYQDDVC